MLFGIFVYIGTRTYIRGKTVALHMCSQSLHWIYHFDWWWDVCNSNTNLGEETITRKDHWFSWWNIRCAFSSTFVTCDVARIFYLPSRWPYTFWSGRFSNTVLAFCFLHSSVILTVMDYGLVDSVFQFCTFNIDLIEGVESHSSILLLLNARSHRWYHTFYGWNDGVITVNKRDDQINFHYQITRQFPQLSKSANVYHYDKHRQFRCLSNADREFVNKNNKKANNQ